MDSDKFTIEILGDGTLKTTTDEVSGANHDSAESFLRNMAKKAGGETKRVSRHGEGHKHHHTHTHDHVKQS